jgi:hypothetical protein
LSNDSYYRIKGIVDFVNGFHLVNVAFGRFEPPLPLKQYEGNLTRLSFVRRRGYFGSRNRRRTECGCCVHLQSRMNRFCIIIKFTSIVYKGRGVLSACSHCLKSPCSRVDPVCDN